MEKTQVLPAIREAKPVADAPAPSPPEPTSPPGRRRRRRESAVEPAAGIDTPQAPGQEAPADDADRRAADDSHLDETQVIPVVRDEPVSPAPDPTAPAPEPDPDPDQADSGRHHAVVEPVVEDEPEAAGQPATPEDEPAGTAEASPLDETQVIPVVRDGACGAGAA